MQGSNDERPSLAETDSHALMGNNVFTVRNSPLPTTSTNINPSQNPL